MVLVSVCFQQGSCLKSFELVKLTIFSDGAASERGEASAVCETSVVPELICSAWSHVH